MVEKNAVLQRLGFKGNEIDGMIDFRLKAVIKWMDSFFELITLY